MIGSGSRGCGALAEVDALILTHVDELDTRGLCALGAALSEVPDHPGRPQPWVAITRHPGAGNPNLAQLASHFSTSVTVPPPRMRLEDLPGLVACLLAKLGHGAQVSCSAAAMRLLMRCPWPGDVHQLQHLIREVGQHRRCGVISAEDLPPDMHSISRRVLSTFESMERDAIVQSLADTDGNKLQAARTLGISRATIYRKIHEFGIVAHN